MYIYYIRVFHEIQLKTSSKVVYDAVEEIIPFMMEVLPGPKNVMKSRLTIIIYLKFFLKLRIIEQACIVMQIDFHSNSNEPSAVYCGIYRKHVIMQNDVSNQDETRIGYRK